MKVLHVTNIWPVGDSYRGIFVKELVDALGRIGVENDVEIVAQGRSKTDYLLARPRIRQRARQGGYDLVHVHYGLTTPAARAIRRIPKVLQLYGSDVNVRWQRWVTILGGAGFDARIYVSENLRANAADRDGYVIANGVDFTLFAPGDRDQARTAHGIKPDEQAILFGGDRENHVKGYDVFRDVVGELRSRGWNARELILAGPDQPRSEVPRKFDAADVLLFTSRKGSEGSPGVIREATVMGLPVVSVNVGDAAKQLNGITPSEVVDFPAAWGSDAARTKLIGALADATGGVLAADTRSNGRERNGWMDSTVVAQRVLEVYRKVLGHHD